MRRVVIIQLAAVGAAAKPTLEEAELSAVDIPGGAAFEI
jgi:hypothetical protein